MKRVAVTRDQTWEIDDEGLVREFRAEWEHARDNQGMTVKQFIEETAAMLTDGWQREASGCRLVSDPYPEVEWKS